MVPVRKNNTLRMPEVSIIILSYNTKDFLRNCLQSVYIRLHELNYEVIVVDNASSDGSAQMVKKEFPKAHLIENKKNVGFAAGNNIGAKRAKGDYILLLNSDTELLHNGLPDVLDHLR